MKKDLIFTALISALIASTVTAFASGPGPKFTDVDDNAYYANSVYRMQSMRVIEGYGDNKFGPEDYVTRGQLATILDRYDQGLITDPDNTGKTVSGIADLQDLLCSGAIDFSSEKQYVQDIHARTCLPDGMINGS